MTTFLLILKLCGALTALLLAAHVAVKAVRWAKPHIEAARYLAQLRRTKRRKTSRRFTAAQLSDLRDWNDECDSWNGEVPEDSR